MPASAGTRAPLASQEHGLPEEAGAVSAEGGCLYGYFPGPVAILYGGLLALSGSECEFHTGLGDAPCEHGRTHESLCGSGWRLARGTGSRFGRHDTLGVGARTGHADWHAGAWQRRPAWEDRRTAPHVPDRREACPDRPRAAHVFATPV